MKRKHREMAKRVAQRSYDKPPETIGGLPWQAAIEVLLVGIEPAGPERDAEDVALRAKWITWESEDPLWLDLGRVIERMYASELGRNLAKGFVKMLPIRHLVTIAHGWCRAEGVRREISTGCLETMKDKLRQRGIGGIKLESVPCYDVLHQHKQPPRRWRDGRIPAGREAPRGHRLGE